jgi:hypothetical protein
MRVAAAIAVWGRPRTAEIVLRQAVKCFDAVVVVRSPGDPEPAPDIEGVIYVEHTNEPLSDKWTAAIRRAGELADAVCMLGSDDLVNEAFVAALRDMLDDGYDYIQPSAFWMYDVRTMRCAYGEAFRIGGGRTFSRRMLEHVGWKLWDEPAHIGGLDSAMDRRLDEITLPQRMKNQRRKGRILLSLKTDNKWGFDQLSGLVRAVYHPVKFWNHHFPEIAEEVLTL